MISSMLPDIDISPEVQAGLVNVKIDNFTLLALGSQTSTEEKLDLIFKFIKDRGNRPDDLELLREALQSARRMNKSKRVTNTRILRGLYERKVTVDTTLDP